MAGGASPAAVLTDAVTRLAWQQHQANVNAAAEAAALRAMHEESARLAAANAAADEAARMVARAQRARQLVGPHGAANGQDFVGLFQGCTGLCDGWMLARAPASTAQ
ncbi:unnamed protein product, partial [Ascophyllum nodosum]